MTDTYLTVIRRKERKKKKKMVHIVSFDEEDLVGSYSASPSSSIRSPSSTSLTSFDLPVQPNLSDHGLAVSQHTGEKDVSVISTSCPPTSGFQLDNKDDNQSVGYGKTKESALAETSGLNNLQYYNSTIGADTSEELQTANLDGESKVSTSQSNIEKAKGNSPEEIKTVTANITDYQEEQDSNKEDTHSVNSKEESDSKIPLLDSNELAR